MRRLIALVSVALLVLAAGQAVSAQSAPTENECRPHIEKALKELTEPAVDTAPSRAEGDGEVAAPSSGEEDDGGEVHDADVEATPDDGESEESSVEMMQSDAAADETTDADAAQGDEASQEVGGEADSVEVAGDAAERESAESAEEAAEGEGAESVEDAGDAGSAESVEEAADDGSVESVEEAADAGSVESAEDAAEAGSVESAEGAADDGSGESAEEAADTGSVESAEEPAEAGSVESAEEAADAGSAESVEGAAEGESAEADDGDALSRGRREATEETEGDEQDGDADSVEGDSLEEGGEGGSEGGSQEGDSNEGDDQGESQEAAGDASVEQADEAEGAESADQADSGESAEAAEGDDASGEEAGGEEQEGEGDADSVEATGGEESADEASTETAEAEGEASSEETGEGEASSEAGDAGDEEASAEAAPEGDASAEEVESTGEASSETEEAEEEAAAEEEAPAEVEAAAESEEATEGDSTEGDSTEGDAAEGDSTEGDAAEGDSTEGDATEGDAAEGDSTEGDATEGEASTESAEGEAVTNESAESAEAAAEDADEEAEEAAAPVDEEEAEPTPEEELSFDVDIPENLRPRDHIAQILRLDEDSVEDELVQAKTAEATLKELKRFYDSAIKPLEILYKYRDLSNRHFGDPEIFSKPLVLFMGPWSGGKSSIINYLLDNEYKRSSLRTGAEPSPAYFNILMWGEREEVMDGTQLAADWTFSGLQKFGQGLLDRLRGLRLNNRLLEKVNIVEIPGILEIRKQVERLFPFNDACQWFIDRADIIFLVYDPAKLDVGPETEAILDQLKGREYQTRIVLNKADQVRPEELMRVQGTLIWNISPLMSSTQPPVMYSTSLWSMPYEIGAPLRLLRAQERAFLRDMRDAIDHRVENKIASARRFAVRVRNHAKMVDCYLTTYYNHKSFFGNRKKVADDIIEKPQDYHIYEGLSTLTNISRYDLPDPDTYRDFFRVNPLYEFELLASTCTYFKGCPINRLDVTIAYELPELVGKYKKAAEAAAAKVEPKS